MEKIAGKIKGRMINLVGKTSLTLLPAVVKKCQTLISTDSGPLFLGVAAGIKTIGLYGPTDSRRHAPPGTITLERKEVPCRPCYRKTCSQPLCMEKITPEEVWSFLE